MPDDPIILEMDPVTKLYLYHQWQQDGVEKSEIIKNHAYVVGGFSNPEMLKKILAQENNTVSVSDEDFEKSLRMVKEDGNNEDKSKVKRRRRKK